MFLGSRGPHSRVLWGAQSSETCCLISVPALRGTPSRDSEKPIAFYYDPGVFPRYGLRFHK